VVIPLALAIDQSEKVGIRMAIGHQLSIIVGWVER